ncbi:Uncharacterised protein [Chlamydia trachomatis]|nr:Uncharacterised protein [Chlamydia trachomatis]
MCIDLVNNNSMSFRFQYSDSSTDFKDSILFEVSWYVINISVCVDIEAVLSWLI